jgi:hypothetical protein
MSREWLSSHDGSVLLSVVTQALLLYLSCVHVSFLPLSAMAASGTSGPMRDGFHTETHPRLRVAEGGILL